MVEIFVSNEKDPVFNLALEEFLFHASEKSNNKVLFYINDSAVIVGKHQNPWQECDLTFLKKSGIDLLRRFSGGGAVYHDVGNVNFSFMTSLQRHKPEVNAKYICDALETLGMAVKKEEKNDLVLNGRKFSGSAFAIKKQRALHHGTLLVNVDLESMNRALLPSFSNISGKGTVSRPAEVINLSQINAELSAQNMMNYLAKHLATILEGGRIQHFSKRDMNSNHFNSIIERHKSWEWKFAQTPDFELSIANDEYSGGFDVKIEKGLIAKISRIDDIGMMSFIGKRFSVQIIDEMMKALKETKNRVELEVY